MIYTDKTIVVEGKYDKIKLSSLIDGVIIQTDGFDIFKNKEKQELLRTLAKKTGLVVLTDSDNAGFRIRRFIRNICGGENVADAYIPDIAGKEKRKPHPSKEGKLGVEGVPQEAIVQALTLAGASCDKREEAARKITKTDFLEAGLTGGQNSSQRRAALLKELNLPERLTTNSLITVLNALITYEEFLHLVQNLPSSRP